jgi:putative nucleotidyltransferase with HDIG domain
MEETKQIAVDAGKIKMAVNNGVPLTIITYTLPREMEVYMGEVLAVFLREIKQERMTDFLTYCLSELVTNAKKANTKRVYFQEKNLIIDNPIDYDAGMKNFKADTLSNINYYLHKQKEKGYFVKLILQARNNKIKIEVRNNAALTFFEYKRMHDKLSRAQQFVSVEEAFQQILDDSEGAGLGLVILILMLRKGGMTEENFRILSENGETITRIVLPINEKYIRDLGVLSDELANLIDTLPQFPDNIISINRLLNAPDSKLSDIAQFISTDVALSGDLLKMVNSASFGLSNPCRSITDAVKMVGMRGIRNLLYSIGATQSLGEATPNAAALWKHANQTAFYSYNLARNYFAGDRRLVEDAYVCGLLHDMGKIVLEAANEKLFKTVLEICGAKGIPSTLIETLASGTNHAEVGAKIAEKWNFPDVITNIIRHHHDPELSSSEFIKLTSNVYFADLLCHYQSGKIEYYQFDAAVLELFHISSEPQLKSLSEKLAQAFKADSRAKN